MSILGSARSFATLSREEQRIAVVACAVLVVVVVSLKTGGLALAEKRLARLPTLLPRAGTLSAKRIATLVDATAKHLPGALCLARSLTLKHLVDHMGTHATLNIGVRHGEAIPLDAHAWVEIDGVVLNDDDDVRTRFAVIQTRA